MHLSSISNEQQSVIDSLVLDYNIIVDYENKDRYSNNQIDNRQLN